MGTRRNDLVLPTHSLLKPTSVGPKGSIHRSLTLGLMARCVVPAIHPLYSTNPLANSHLHLSSAVGYLAAVISICLRFHCVGTSDCLCES